MIRGSLIATLAAAALVSAAPAAADDWLPHPHGARWEYAWRDSVYHAAPVTETVSVERAIGAAFTLGWKGALGAGTVTFGENATGLSVTDWTSDPPPPSFPVLCPTESSCGNSLAGSLYDVIWGNRTLVLPEPLLHGVTWSSTGGAQGDVSSVSGYLGVEKVSVPAFPKPVAAAKVRSELAQAGALGDPYGSGIRTIWWVYGVGPVKIVFQHGSGANAPVTTAVLRSTTLKPLPPPSDVDWFPLRKGLKGTYRWTNARHLRKPEVQRFSIDAAANRAARFSFRSVSGPIGVAGAYGFSLGPTGVLNTWATTKAASIAKLPPLGPRSLPAGKRRHFFTPFDLMTFGFNPLLPPYGDPGATWSARAGTRDFSVYGVQGTARILGVQTVKVPAGTFRALAVRTTLRQDGFPFGSGTRTSWFAPGRGLVKLVFRHGDGSVSLVELLR